MKNFVSFNISPYSKGEAKDLINHSNDLKHRSRSTNISFPQYTKYNVKSDHDILSKYYAITKKIEKIKGKKIQKNANHYLEGVLAFSFDKFRDDPKKFRDQAPELIEKYMQKICKTYGFEPVGWSLHFDEGFKNSDSKDLNVHAHIHMINYDFIKNKSRFREIQQKFVKKRKFPNPHFVEMQDIAHEIFYEELGFTRGVSKDITLKEHLSKEEFITKKIKDKELSLEHINKKISKIRKISSIESIKLSSTKEKIKEEERKLKSIKSIIENVINKFKTNLQKFVLDIQKKNFDKIYDDADILKEIIDSTSKNNNEISNAMIHAANSVSESLQVPIKFTRKGNRNP